MALLSTFEVLESERSSEQVPWHACMRHHQGMGYPGGSWGSETKDPAVAAEKVPAGAGISNEEEEGGILCLSVD